MGKTFRVVFRTAIYEKHPHARGEDLWKKRKGNSKMETPPRTWGRPLENEKTGQKAGNTPTHVGKTPRDGRQGTAREKHPHARGEDHRRWRPVWAIVETPPRTWGRHKMTTENRDKFGNTPTHVGKTVWCGDLCMHKGKHPHARGEDRTAPYPRALL